MKYQHATVIVKASCKTGAFAALENLYNSVKENYNGFREQEDGSVYWELKLVPNVCDTDSTKWMED